VSEVRAAAGGADASAGPMGGGMVTGRAALRVGNCSGFYGDRFSAMEEMLTGGPLDVLTGDYLAELTMLILGRDRLKDPGRGYAGTFLRQLETGLGLARERGVRIVTNAGGLNPAALADSVRELSQRVGVPAAVAHVEGDDVLARGGWGEGALTANAYLGGGGIAACLRGGADVVVTGRVTDAALVTGAAAAHFGWADDDWDALSGAVVAGHVLDCGAQATGGNYAFFAEEGIDVRRPGFPLAEIERDGTCVVTKHPGTGGAVTVGTVTAQLLYETAGARYPGPDVTARLDSVLLRQVGEDRVRIEGAGERGGAGSVRGEPPPATLKQGVTRMGGWRNEVVFVLTGLDVGAKAELVKAQMEDAFERAGRRPAEVRWTLARTDSGNAPAQEEASAMLRMAVRDREAEAVGRAVSGAGGERGGRRAGARQLSGLPRDRAAGKGVSVRSVRGGVRGRLEGAARRGAAGRAARRGTRGGGGAYEGGGARRGTGAAGTTSPPPTGPPAVRRSEPSPVPGAGTRAAARTSGCGCGARRRGDGWRTR
jgi:hypothetical protein